MLYIEFHVHLVGNSLEFIRIYRNLLNLEIIKIL